MCVILIVSSDDEDKLKSRGGKCLVVVASLCHSGPSPLEGLSENSAGKI